MTRPREPQATDDGSAPDTPAAWLDEPRPAGAWRAGWFVASTAFLLYPVVHVLSIPAAPLEAALAIAAVLIFGSVLVRALLVDDGRIGLTGPLIVVQVLALLCIAAVLAAGWPDAGWSPIGYFASVSAGGVLPERRALWLLALCGGLMAIAMLIGGANPGDALLSGIGITVIGFVVFALNGLRRTNQALLRARADLARMAVLEERERIARDLHDTLGHSLSLITLKSELARRLLPDDPAAAGREIGEVEDAAREALASVRQTVRGFRRPSLDGELEGLVAALRAAGIDPAVERSADGLPGPTDALFAWALREGVTNVMRHSHATRCTIRVGRDGDHAFAEVVDDGVGDGVEGPTRAGMPSGPSIAGSAGADGTGLLGLAQRVADQGGEVVAGSLPGRGYRLRVTLPVTGWA